MEDLQDFEMLEGLDDLELSTNHNFICVDCGLHYTYCDCDDD